MVGFPSGAVVTRFAPSPTGALHLGHAYAAIVAHDLAHSSGGRFLVRIEDIDRGRCRVNYEDGIFRDLDWLGLGWEPQIRRQSDHMSTYEDALAVLRAKGVVYPCFCTRRQIADEIARSPSAPHGPEGALYPGTCRTIGDGERSARIERGEPFAVRLDCRRAHDSLGRLTFVEAGAGPGGETGDVVATPLLLGDVVLARKDVRTSYHLAVTVDDALQGVTVVTRGRDLFDATHVHRLLQGLLDLPVPTYFHHDLVRDEHGVRLATRDKALALDALRADGITPTQIRERLGVA